MCRRSAVDLPLEMKSAAYARRFLDDEFARWDLAEVYDDASLAVSELVTNSLIHAQSPMILTVAVTAGLVEVGVRDEHPELPVVRPARDDLLSDLDAIGDALAGFDDAEPRQPHLWAGPALSVVAGRGLQLVDAVSEGWGVRVDPAVPGKEVWTSHEVPSAWPYAPGCSCLHASELLSPSGRPVRHLSGAWDDTDSWGGMTSSWAG